MSWKLPACLKFCGLEERWLKILKTLDIDTFEDLESRIDDGDLCDVLHNAATEEEKEALQSLVSKDCVNHIAGMQVFENILEKCGLDPSSFRETFAEAGILTQDDLLQYRGNLKVYGNLIQQINDDEKFVVQWIMDIKPEVAAEYEMKANLDQMGLECKYWYPIFKDVLGMCHPLLLQYICLSDFLILQANARHENEVSIIKQCLLEDDVTFSTRQIKDKDKSCRYYRNIEKHLLELKELLRACEEDIHVIESDELCKKNKDLQHMQVKLRRENIGILLQIPRSEFTEDSSIILASIEVLEQQMQDSKLKDVLTSDVADAYVVGKASDSLLFQGIYLTADEKESICPREKVLSSTSGFALSDPTLNYHNASVCFSSQELQESFVKSLRSKGYSLTAAEKFENCPSYEIVPKVQDVEEACDERACFVLLKYLLIPIASSYFDMENLLLCEDALNELKEIENTIGMSDKLLHKKCENFFSKYGSHVNTGKINLGGIFLFKLRFERSTCENQEAANRLANDVMEDILTSGLRCYHSDSFANYEVAESLKIKYEDSYFGNFSISVETIGGQSCALSYLQWKLELIGDKSSWAVIDRGFNLKGIWELLVHQKCHFEKPEMLAKILCSAWESKTGLKTGQVPNKKYLVEVPRRVNELSTFIENGITDPGLSKDCEMYLDYINTEKDELIFISRDNSLWHSCAKEIPYIAHFFNTVIQNMENYFKNSYQSSSFLLLQLVDGFSSNCFQENHALFKWLKANESHSRKQATKTVMYTFISAIKKFVITKLSPLQNDKSNTNSFLEDGKCISVTNDLAVYTSNVLEKLYELGEHHVANLVALSLIQLGYDHRSRCFSVWLSVEKVETFLEDFEEMKILFFRYRNQGVVKAECHLLDTAIKISKGHLAMSESISKVSHMLKIMKTNFCPQVKNIIDKHESSPDQWDKLETYAQSVLFETAHKDDKLNTLGVSLERVMQVSLLSSEEVQTSVLYSEALQIPSHKRDKIVNYSILESLGLTEYFPSKISMQDVMKAPADKLETMHDIPWYILQKLLMLDYRGRCINTLPNDLMQKQQSKSENLPSKEKVDDDFVDDIFADIESSLEKSPILMPHPLDVLVALFACTSEFLLQVLAEKMFMCHVSIPLLLPNIDNTKLTFLFWTLRTVICEYELPDSTAVESPVVSCSMPIVSFIRLGKVSRSKSKLLNEIISSQGHNTFFHRDCASGVMCPKISEGLVDIAWFLPSKQIKSEINEAVAYLNLHGNATYLSEQRNFLIRTSNVVVILIPIEELANPDAIACIKDVLTSNAKLVFIIAKTLGSTAENYKQLFAKCLKEVGEQLKKQIILLDFNCNGPKNASEMKLETINGIMNCLSGCIRHNLEDCTKLAEAMGIAVDEATPMCLAGQILSKEVFNHIDRNNLAFSKAVMLPLQGDLWHQWGILEKAEHRREGKVRCSEHYAAELHQQKQAIRYKQLQVCNNLPRLFESFLSKLLQVEGVMRLYFLKWLRIFLDGASRKALPGLIKQYNLKWTEINQYKSKKKDESDPYMMALQEELSKIEEKLAMTSLGLEHFMREIGQAFEAVASLPSQVPDGLKDSMHKLPQIMAELMIAGYPLEIMDGDASHVPLSWVVTVLSELKMLIGDKKVFVLSVLGVQSSGKSTLLNTMFGLQFAVSAGRCTRGLYAQLVPVPKSESSSLYDFILVVDTEGLRAPELGSTKHQHDNELATFVIGLGDMTIINIKGENPTEMQDVLQIVVHAFLRMQLVNKNMRLQSSCFFIHQNVGAVNAAGKMIFGQQRLKDNLDQMTVAAADQENVRGYYSFKEVIDFDVEKNVWYFSDLWQGDPPMAPANPGYSKKVSEVKEAILKEMQRKETSSNLSSICIRIEDLWKGILAENFVFSFKNSLELRAYRALEFTLTDLLWSLQNDALKWFNSARNKVQSCETVLPTLVVSLSCEFSTYYISIYDKAEKKLLNFFEKNDDKYILEQWKVRSMLKLKDRKDDTIWMTLNALKDEVEVRKVELSQISKTEVYKVEIGNLAQKLAIELRAKENISEEDLEKKFNSMWKDWMNNISSHHLGHHSVDVKGQVLGIMFDMFSEISSFLAEEYRCSKPWHPSQKLLGNFCLLKDHLNTKKRMKVLWQVASNDKCLEIAYELLNGLFDNIEDYLNSINGSSFSPSQAGTVFKKVCNMIEENNKSQNPFKFTIFFKVHLVIYVCSYAVFRLTKIHCDYLKETDPKTILERNYKQQLLNLFKNKHNNSKNEKMVADILCTCLTDAVNKAVLWDMPRELADDVRSNVPKLHTKGDLLTSVLQDLLKVRGFDEYLLYFKNINHCLRKWIVKYTDNYVYKKKTNGVSRYAELASLQIQMHFKNITNEIIGITEELELKSGNFQQWLKIFHKRMRSKLPLPESNLSLVAQVTIEDIGFFKESLMKNLALSKVNLENRAKFVSGGEMYLHKNTVYILLEKECLGCCEQCPFCKAPCSLTISGHDVKHSALQHYPQAFGTYRCSVSNKLTIENCSYLVSSNGTFYNKDTDWAVYPYKEYSKFYPNWKIQGDPSMEASLYWKWFIANYASQLAKAYNALIPDIPFAWKLITPLQAEASLNK